jgi:uncharacterized protein YjbJ (UPF0337 family)
VKRNSSLIDEIVREGAQQGWARPAWRRRPVSTTPDPPPPPTLGVTTNRRRCPGPTILDRESPTAWRVPNRENAMSLADKAKNKVEELQGKSKEATGRATGDNKLKAEGKADQAKTKLKQTGEKIKEKIKDAFK